MARNKFVFVSDIHIGSNAITNWYQPHVHESMLVSIFEHVIARADEFAEVVILGDLVDQWTYVPETQPPSLDEIAKNNPIIFGTDGVLARVVRALEGRVTYMPGNHDMALGQNPGHLSRVVGTDIRSFVGPIYEPPAGKGQIACTHGHIYSMFNAPDFVADPKNGLPLGHFITRLAALHASRSLKSGQTVADLPQSGDPTGTALLGDAVKGIFESFLTTDVSLTRVTIQTLLDAVGAGPEFEFVMLDGSRITARAVFEAYENLQDTYGAGRQYPVSIYGRNPAMLALTGTDARNTIAHFADVLSTRYPAIVMGHTHTPDDQSDAPLFAKPYLYANSGFNCPSRPDMAKKDDPGRATFIELTLDEGARTISSAVRYVATQGNIASVAPEPLSPPLTTPMR